MGGCECCSKVLVKLIIMMHITLEVKFNSDLKVMRKETQQLHYCTRESIEKFSIVVIKFVIVSWNEFTVNRITKLFSSFSHKTKTCPPTWKCQENTNLKVDKFKRCTWLIILYLRKYLFQCLNKVYFEQLSVH